MPADRAGALISGMTGGFLLVVSGALAVVWLKIHAPLLEVDNPHQELRQSSGQKGKLTVSFRIRNVGKSPLQIDSVATSCGCAVASFPQHELGPGTEGTIEVQAFTPLVGKKDLYVLVKSNCRRNPRTELSITGFSERIAPVVYGSPSLIYFEGITRERETQPVWIKTVERADGAPWIERLCCDLPFISVSDVVVVRSVPFSQGYLERHYSFRVAVQTVPKPGEYRGRVAIPNSDAVAVPVFCRVPEPFTSIPPAVYASFDDNVQGTFEFRLRSRSSELPQFTNVTTNLADQILVQSSPSEEGGDPVWVVRVVRPPTEGVLGGEIVLTDSSATSCVRVPVMLSRVDRTASSED